MFRLAFGGRSPVASLSFAQPSRAFLNTIDTPCAGKAHLQSTALRPRGGPGATSPRSFYSTGKSNMQYAPTTVPGHA